MKQNFKKDETVELDQGLVEPVSEESLSVVSAPKPEGLYKLNLYRSNGLFRTDIPASLIYDLSKNWGDLMRVIPGNRWSSQEEIVQMVWDWEKKQYRKNFTRSRKQIEAGILALVEGGVLLAK